MADLKKDLEILYDLEMNNYMMTKMIKKIDETTSKLGHPQHIEQPKVPGKSKVSIFGRIFDSGALVGGILAVIGAIFGFIGGFMVQDGAIAGFFLGIFLAIIFGIIGAVIGAVIGGIFGIGKGVYDKANDNERIERQWKDAQDEYYLDAVADKARVAREKRQIVFLNQQRREITTKKQLATQILNEFYEKVGINERFRYLVAIGYMYENIVLGIATQLEGANGLYDKVKQELRYDQFQLTLEEISAKLDVIINQNSMIYTELNQINRKCSSIVSNTAKIAQSAEKLINDIDNIKRNSEESKKSLEAMQKNTEVSNYILERTRKEQEYQNYFIRRNI